MTALDLEFLLKTKRIIVCCGSGGIGKTTVSAALGVQGAITGKTVLTLTIDPAKRLANSLGLKELGNTETLVPEAKFHECGSQPTGSLYAMMLDTKHTFDELIQRYAPSEEIKKNILDNQFYQNLSSAMAGSHEYLAMEKLYQIYLEGRYDLIVLDTPPTRHALDFLEAPNRVRAFFDRSISQWFLKPYLAMSKLGLNFFNRSAYVVLKMVERVTGAEFLHDVSEFVAGLADSFDIFRSRAEEVMRLLQGEATAFLLITGTELAAIEEATFFYDQLRKGQLPFGGIIVNRVHSFGHEYSGLFPDAGSGESSDQTTDPIQSFLQTERSLSPAVVRRLADNYRQYHHLYERDRSILMNFINGFPQNVPIRTIPAFDEDIYDLSGLLKVGEFLFAPGQSQHKSGGL